MKAFFLSVAMAAGIAGGATAATISNVNVAGAGTDPFIGSSTTLPAGALWGIAPDVETGTLNGFYVSPFLNGAGEETAPFFNVLGGEAARLLFDGPRNSLSLLWGSVDLYNSITFFLGATQVAFVTLNDFTSPDISFVGDFVTISDVIFDSVTFASQFNSFEFAAVQATAPIPLPAAGVLLLGALGLLVAAGRRRPAG